MPTEIRRASSRFLDRSARGEPGRATAHAFSFGAHYDPAWTGFGPMVVHDDHRLASGSGFDDHHHAGVVVVSWVLSGALEHHDTATGRTETVRPGQVAVLHTGPDTGGGVTHREVAAAPQTRFVQVWLTPDEQAPSYGVTSVDLPTGSLVEVSRPLPGGVFSVVRLADGDTVALPAAPRVHVFVGRGALIRSSLAEPLADGDAFLFTDEPGHEVTAGADTELLVWSFES